MCRLSRSRCSISFRPRPYTTIVCACAITHAYPRRTLPTPSHRCMPTNKKEQHCQVCCLDLIMLFLLFLIRFFYCRHILSTSSVLKPVIDAMTSMSIPFANIIFATIAMPSARPSSLPSARPSSLPSARPSSFAVSNEFLMSL